MSVIKPEMISDRITRRDLLPLSFLKKSAYTGSKRKLNYKLAKTEIPVGEADESEAQETVLRVYSWTGLFSYEATDPAEIDVADMEFSDAGIDAAIEYLNLRLESSEAGQRQ